MGNNNYSRDIRSFSFYFILRTEAISYFLIVPMIIFYVCSNLNLTEDQLRIFLICAIFTFIISFLTTHINNMIVLSPVVKYFRKLVKNESFTDEEYSAAFKRFLGLPYIHSIGAFFRWIFGLGIVIILTIHFGQLNLTQSFNMWMTVIINAPLGAVVYFLLTELYVQRVYNQNVFLKWTTGVSNRKINLYTRLTVSNTVLGETHKFTRELAESNLKMETRIGEFTSSANDIYNSSLEQQATTDELTKMINNIYQISMKTAESAELMQTNAGNMEFSVAGLLSHIEVFKT